MSKTNYDDAIKQSIDYFNGDELAASVYINKYAINVDGDYIEPTPEKMHERLSKEYARMEDLFGGPNKLSKNTIHELFDRFKYIVPAGSVMSGLGNENYKGSLSNCFVIGSPSDSYASIMRYREFQIQLMKRRGGCIEENTTVLTKEFGIIPIKDVKVGNHVLSFNVSTGLDEWKRVNDKYPAIVKQEDQIELRYKNGVILKTSTNHPVLTIGSDGYSYKKHSDGELKGSWNKSPNFKKFSYDKNVNDDIAWFVGCHMGDGTCDKKKDSYRLRIVGNNKSVIDEYKRVNNQIIKKDVGVVSIDKKYKSLVWSFSVSNKENAIIAEDYIDGQINKKTYTWHVPKYIKRNDLWVPFLAGLVDADGYVTKSGRIDISICSKNAIDDISKFLSASGQSYSVKVRTPKRTNESVIYNLHIHKETDIYGEILKYIKHDVKKEKMGTSSKKYQSDSYMFTEKEVEFLLGINYRKFTSDRKLYNLYTKNKQNLKDNRIAGKSLLKELINNNLIEDCVYDNICSRTVLSEIHKDVDTKFNYIDIEVEGNNNYYAGGFGFVNIHNCGKDISGLRPSGSSVNNAAKSSTGPVSFMDVDSELTKEVAQGGRRGALMLSISCLHPDSDQFILKKQDSTKVNGANISVQFTDEFMECVEKDTTFVQRYPIGADITELDLDKLPLNEKVWDGGKCYKLIKATDLWNSFVHCSWNKAEPGVMFCDKHWEFSPDSVYPQYKGVTTNPCGEIFMGPYDSCRLMHINLSSFVENPFTPNAKLDEKGLYEVAYMNMQLCDDLVELELEHVSDIIEHIKSTYNDDVATELSLWEKVYETGKSSRRAGCGATSLGDVLAMLSLGMNTEEGLRMVDTIAKIKMTAEIQAQVDLARERGTFVGYDFDKEFGYDEEKGVYYGKNGFFQRVIDMGIPEDLILEMKKYGRRNVSWSTMAPVGSASLMTQTTSGIEPLFSPFYKRRKKCGDSNDRVDFIDKTGEKFTEFYVLHGKFKEWIMEHSGEYDHTLSFDEQMSDDRLNYLFSKSPWYGSTAAELSPENHVLVQSIFQYYTTHSISKTINLPKNVTEGVVSDLFMKAWKLSLKGLTVYRDGCRDGILVKDDKDCDCKTSLTHSSPKRPKSMPCEIKRFRNGGEKWIAAVGLYNGKPYEIFTGLSEKLDIPEYVKEAEIIKNYVVKMVPDEDTEEMVEKKVSRYDIKYITNDNKSVTVDGISNVFNPEFYNYSKLISGLLRHGMPIEYILSTVKSLDFKVDSINNWKNGVMRALKSYITDGVTKELCSKCGSPLHRENGCVICKNCGDSKCG